MADKLTLAQVKEQAIKAAQDVRKAEIAGEATPEARKAIFDDAMKGAPHRAPEAKKAIGEFLRNLTMGVTKDLEESVGANGGYLTPLEFSSTLIELLYKLPVIRANASVLPMTSDQMQVPVETATVNANWTAELATITQSDPTFGEVILAVNNLIGISRMSRQILMDSAINERLVDWVMNRFAASIARVEDAAFMAGSGTGQPKGIRQYTFANTVAQAGANLTADDIIALYHKLPFQYRAQGNPVWLMHDSVLQKIRSLKDNTGRYLYEEGYGQVLTTAGVTPTLLGKPVLVQNDIPTNLGAGTDESEVYFGDLSYYLIGDREQVFSEVSTQEGTSFAQHRAAVKVGERLDGQLATADGFAQLTAVK